jgi:hypothetical protein
MQRWRLRILVAVLFAVIAWAWATDGRGPAYPHGQFREVVSQTLVLVAVVGLVGFVWRELRSPLTPRQDETTDHDTPK